MTKRGTSRSMLLLRSPAASKKLLNQKKAFALVRASMERDLY